VQTIYNFDLKVFSALNGSAGMGSVADGVIVFLANYLPYFVVAGLLFWLWRSKAEVGLRLQVGTMALFSGLVARFGVAEIIRLFYHRPRPFVYHSVSKLFSESSYSFPSGHTIFFFALAAAVYFYNPRAGNWLFVLAAVIGVARIAAGVHYPSDILAGAILGIITAYIMVKLVGPVLAKFLKTN
jgi:undecaprenyl-diphosphatase